MSISLRVLAFFYCSCYHLFFSHREVMPELLWGRIVRWLIDYWRIDLRGLLLYRLGLHQILLCLHTFCQCSSKGFVLRALDILVRWVLVGSSTRLGLFYVLSNLVILCQTCSHGCLEFGVLVWKLRVHSQVTTRLCTREALVHLLWRVRLLGRAEHRVETHCNRRRGVHEC